MDIMEADDMSDSRNKSEIINPVEHYLLQQIQESGSAVRATWEVINNIVKHFFIVNAILIGFAGVVWTEYGKEAKEISAKEKIIQAECVRLNLPESHFNKTVGEAVQMGKEIATKCKEKGKIGFIESLTQWNVILTLIGVFGIGTIIFCMLALIRIGPGYGQNFLDSAAAAEKKLIELIGQGHELRKR